MLNQTHKDKKFLNPHRPVWDAWPGRELGRLSLLLGIVVALMLSAGVSLVMAAPVEPSVAAQQVVPPPAQEEDKDEDNDDDDDDDEAAEAAPPVDPVAAAEDMRVLLEEMTFVQLLDEEYGYAKTACAGNGLNNIQPLAEGPMVLIPNAGDLSVDGSNVSVKLNPDGEITFIPRVQGQRIRVPMDLDDKVEGEEVLSLSLAEAEQLIAAGHLVWTAQDHGPYGNGHGLPGHLAACDPLFDEEQFEEFEESREEAS